MAKEINNPRFPHYCVIYRTANATSFSRGEREEIYRGPCRKSSSDNIRSFNTGDNRTGKVDTIDMRISMPGIVKGIQKGDLMDIEDLVTQEIGMRIVMIDATRLGEYITEDANGNRITIKGGTAVLCTNPSN